MRATWQFHGSVRLATVQCVWPRYGEFTEYRRSHHNTTLIAIFTKSENQNNTAHLSLCPYWYYGTIHLAVAGCFSSLLAGMKSRGTEITSLMHYHWYFLVNWASLHLSCATSLQPKALVIRCSLA